MRGFLGIVLRELLVLEKRLFKQLASMAVSPALYLIAFGLGIGKKATISGEPYLKFLIPGLITMSSMFHSYSIAVEINIARFYLKIFDEFMASPLSTFYYVLGEVFIGILRAVVSVLIIIAIGYLSGVFLNYGAGFWMGVLVTAFLFASLAVIIAMVVKNHADQALVTNFVITPMAFLGGTFFPIEYMPKIVQKLLLLIPLTHSSMIIRQSAYGKGFCLKSFILLLIEGLILFGAALYTVGKAKD